MSTEDARTALAFQIAAQLPANPDEAISVLELAAALVRFAAKQGADRPEGQERVPPLRVVEGGGSSF